MPRTGITGRQRDPRALLPWGRAGGMLRSALAHPLLFPGQRSREEQAAGKEGQQTSLGTDGTFSMEENSLYSSRGKGRHRELGKGPLSWVCLHVSRSGASPPVDEAPRLVLHRGAAPAAATTCRRRGGKSPCETASSCPVVWQGWVSLRYRAAPMRPQPASPYRPDAASPLLRLREVTSPTAPLWGGRCSSAPCKYSTPPFSIPRRLRGDGEGHRVL